MGGATDGILDLLDWLLAGMRRHCDERRRLGTGPPAGDAVLFRDNLDATIHRLALEVEAGLASLRVRPTPVRGRRAVRVRQCRREYDRLMGVWKADVTDAERAAAARAAADAGEGDADAVDGLVRLFEWDVDGMRRHAEELARRTVGLLTGDRADLTAAEVAYCERLDAAVFALAGEAADVNADLLDRPTPLPPAAAARLAGLRAEYDRVADGWRTQMEAVQHVWADRNPPQ